MVLSMLKNERSKQILQQRSIDDRHLVWRARVTSMALE